MNRKLTRRQVLTAAAAGAALTLCGCRLDFFTVLLLLQITLTHSAAEFFAELFPAGASDAQAKAASPSSSPGDREVLFDGQVRAGASHRVLEDSSDIAGHLVVG